jgi:hypothetical protein
MNGPPVNTPSQDSPQPAMLTPERVVAILWRSAVESFVRAILVVVFGSIAVSMASGIWEEMVPSRPPGFGHLLETENPPPGAPPQWETWFGEHRFVVVFGLIFALTAWFRLVRERQQTEESKSESHLNKITHHLSENWFRLVVGNAFGALISAFVLAWVQRFTFANLVFNWLLHSVLSVLQSLIHQLLGAGRADTFDAWFGWYGDNQLKFTFWFFYLSAICDDLGIPNFKTLGRRLARSVLKRVKRQGGVLTHGL